MTKFNSARLQYLAAIAGVSLACVAAPASAALSGSNDVRVAVAASSAAAATAQRPAKKYCVVDKNVTGSHIARKVCRTAEEWRQMSEEFGSR